jgi:hypothetical protein
MAEPWTKLDEKAYTSIWDRFELTFDFHPSIEPRYWPGIQEPTPSVTYDIGWIYGNPEAETLEAELDEKVIDALRRCVPPSGRVYVLDWQHDCYVVDPHAVSAADLRVPVLPNGDYYLYLAPDVSFGTFGHPWEQTICVFGAPLLAAMDSNRPRLLSRPVRSRAPAA